MNAPVNRFLVQRWTGSRVDGTTWEDVEPIDGPVENPGIWEAATPDLAFAAAVLENPDEHVRATSYRVLPWDGGATFNLSLEINGEAHGRTVEAAHA